MCEDETQGLMHSLSLNYSPKPKPKPRPKKDILIISVGMPVQRPELIKLTALDYSSKTLPYLHSLRNSYVFLCILLNSPQTTVIPMYDVYSRLG